MYKIIYTNTDQNSYAKWIRTKAMLIMFFLMFSNITFSFEMLDCVERGQHNYRNDLKSYRNDQKREHLHSHMCF